MVGGGGSDVVMNVVAGVDGGGCDVNDDDGN